MAISLQFKMVLICGMVITGAANTIFLSLQIKTNTLGIEPYGPHPFNHAFTQTLFMFGGELLCLFAFYIIAATSGQFSARERLRASSQNAESLQNQPLLVEEDGGDQEIFVSGKANKTEEPPQLCFNPFVLLPPAACDLVGSTLSGIGLLYVNPALWQMMRGSIIVFTGILSLVVLRRRLNMYNYLGMGIVTVGLFCVGLSGWLDSRGGDGGSGGQGVSGYFIGIAFILTGMFMNACQFVTEEIILTKRSYPPLQVVGWEGFWGLLGTVVILIPAGYLCPAPANPDPANPMYYGDKYDNAYDAWLQISRNWAIPVLGCCAAFSIAFYNYFGVSVTKHVSSLARALIDCLRTVIIYVFFLAFYYINGGKEGGKVFENSVGSPWSSYQLIQLFGFCLLVLGNIVYDLESFMKTKQASDHN